MQRTRTLLLGSVLFLGLFGLLSLFLVLGVHATEAAMAGVLYVAPGGNCGLASPCYDSIQDALLDADNGDQIKIAAGVYTATSTPVFTVTRAVSLVGGYSTDDWLVSDPDERPTIIDGLHRPGVGLVLVQASSGNTVTLRGLTIQNGHALNDYGAAIYTDASRVVVENSRLISNTADASGGAIYAGYGSTLHCIDVEMIGNVAQHGGAVYGYGSDLYIQESVLEHNLAAGGSGGAVFVQSGSANLTRNYIRHNEAETGGGVYMGWSYLIMRSNTFVGNIARDEEGLNEGGALYLYLFSGQTADAGADIIGGNLANSGVYVENGELRAQDWTLAENGEYAIYNLGTDTMVLTNTIVSTHTNAFYGPFTADYILFNASGEGQCPPDACSHVFNEGDPFFVTTEQGPYHLGVGSAALDRGISGLTKDVDGESRHMGSGIDLGADEMPVVGEAYFEGRGSKWADQIIEFTNMTTSTGKITCLWDFGDMNTATGVTVTHAYQGAGDYSVLLAATSGPFVRTRRENMHIDEAGFSSNSPQWWHETSIFTNTTQATLTPSYWWDFGNGRTSTEANPRFVYLDPGVYTVTLTASNARGSGIATERVVIFGPPDTDFESSGPDWLGQTTLFTDTTTGEGPLTYLWDFGDGQTSAERSPEHQYAAPGAYSVTLTVTNRWPTTKTHSVMVYGEPTALDFTGDPVSGIRPLTVTFQSTVTTTPPHDPSIVYLWDFGDGTTSTEANPQHKYTPYGTYTVTLTTSNAVGSTAMTRTHYIQALAVPVDAGFTANPGLGKVPLKVTFTNISTGDFEHSLWNFGDGVTSTLPSPQHTFTKKGNHPVTLSVSGVGGSDVFTGTIQAKQGNVYLPAVMKH